MRGHTKIWPVYHTVFGVVSHMRLRALTRPAKHEKTAPKQRRFSQRFVRISAALQLLHDLIGGFEIGGDGLDVVVVFQGVDQPHEGLHPL